MKRLSSFALLIMLSACLPINTAETHLLKQAAIESARNQSKDVYLAYLQCYGLTQRAKETCRHQAARSATPDRKNASIQAFILPFDYETERLGFQVFLKDAGKPCAGINQGPRYNQQTNAYDVICTNGYHYFMHFDSLKNQWSLANAPAGRAAAPPGSQG